MIVRTPKGKIYNFPMKGLKEAIGNLNKEVLKIETLSRARLIKAALLIRREAVKLCPADTGNLRNSAYIVSSWRGVRGNQEAKTFKGEDAGEIAQNHVQAVREREQFLASAKNLLVEIGFTAYYAVFVHEVQANHRGKTQWKFLEAALNNNRQKVIDILTGKS